MGKLILATRSSRLAIAQSEIVKRLLAEQNVEVELFYVETAGDADRKSPLRQIGGGGLFVRRVEQAVLAGDADFAVHCGKDLPYQIADGLCVAGIPAADDVRDVLLWRRGETLSEETVIGTGSARRMSEYNRHNAKVRFAEIRGNVTTRLEKLRREEYDGIILAKAGLDRLDIDLQEFEMRVFEPKEMIPAVCQGILAAECRKDDVEVAELLEKISIPKAKLRFEIERSLFCKLRADCSKAVGVYAEIEDGHCDLRALFGEKRVEVSGECIEYKNLVDEAYELLR